MSVAIVIVRDIHLLLRVRRMPPKSVLFGMSGFVIDWGLIRLMRLIRSVGSI